MRLKSFGDHLPRVAQRRRRPGRRHRHPGRAQHPQAADQDRRQADHRAHHRGHAGVAGDRRDHRDDGAGLPRRGAGDRPEGRLRQGQPDPRGGRHPERHHRAALAALGDDECNVLLHDAVRPLVSQTIIAANVEALRTYEAVDTAIPSADTVIQVTDEAGTMADVLPRHLLRRGQTPQSFRLSTIRAAYAKAAQDPNFTATDDCTVVLRYLPEVPIAVVPGHERNMKVTEPIDVYIADKLFQLTCADTPAALSDEEYRARLEGRTVVVFGGSYGIGGDIADLAAAVRGHGQDVLPLHHQHPRGAARGHRRRRPRGAGRDRPDRLRGEHRRRAAARRAGRDHRGDDLRRPPTSTTWRRSSSPRSSSRTSPRPPGRCCCSPPRPTPAVAPATRCTPRPRRRWST